MGANVVDVFWTTGAHDGVLVIEAPDDAVASAVFLTLGKAGDVRTQTLRAYGRDEFEKVVAAMK